MNIAPAAGIVVWRNDGRVLLIQRGDDGAWAIPGGHVEPGESWRECAEREFVEETGARAAIRGVLGIYSDPEHQRHRTRAGVEEQLVGVVFEASIEAEQSFAARDDEEVTGFGWFHPQDLPENVFGPDRVVLADAASSARRPFVR